MDCTCHLKGQSCTDCAERRYEAWLRYQEWLERRTTETAHPADGTCDECGATVPADTLDDYCRCRRCYENWESSQEGPFAVEGPTLQEQCARAREMKDGRRG